MRAAVPFEQGKPQRVEEVKLEAPRRGELLVRMAASGVCHSCLHAADGSWKGVPLPIVLGDEAAGVVEALGPEVTELAVGDHVVLSWASTCGRCHYCVIGRPNLCERRQPGKGVLPDGTTRMSLGGGPVYHYGHVATYASQTVVHESCATRIDPAMPLDRAALIGCSVMTGVGAVTFVAVGATRPITQAVDALAPGGTCLLIGVPETGATAPLDVRPMVTGELRIDEMITHRYALEDANEAFRALAAGELARGVIVF
jgi:Zn-dependent alcohol dehydrogenase